MPKYTILLIDYDPRSVAKMKGPLERAGYAVETAADGLAGMEAFDRLRPSLTMVEAMIPKKHGFEVCKELKQTPHGQSSPVIIVTSVYKGRRYRNQAKHQYDCDEYLEKPIADEDLVAVVDRFLDDGSAMESEPVTAPTTRSAETSIDTAEAEISDHLDSLLS